VGISGSREEVGTTSAKGRIGATGFAVATLALGFAVPARADDPVSLPLEVAAAAADPAATAPIPPDTSAATAQLGAANVNISIRVDSPGDNGAVGQTISAAAAGSGETGATTGAKAPQVVAGDPAAAIQATVVQAAPANVDLSVRVRSAGADGAVTQTIDADAASADQTQYQPAAGEYQGQAPASASGSSLSTPVASPAPAVAAAPTLPATWNWNWTWTCGDTTNPGTTQTIDTGIQGWIWTWNLGGMCGIKPPSLPDIPAVNLPQSLSEIVTPPLPPSPPAFTTPAPAAMPIDLAPLAVEPAPAVLPVAVSWVEQFSTSELDGVISFPLFPAPTTAALQVPSPFRRAASTVWSAASAEPTASPVHTAKRSPDASTQTMHRVASLAIFEFAPPAGGGGAAGGGSGGGSSGGATAALAVWLLLALPGLALLRLPAGRRAPRAPVEEIRARPG